MKGFSRLFMVVLVTTSILVSACGGGLPTEGDSSVGGNKPLASLVEVQGYIEAISGNQWTINGQVVTVDESMLNDDDDLSDFQVGDYIEIKAEASADGSLIAREVDSSDDGNENGDDSNSNDDDNSNNSNDDDSNSNDDSNDNDDDSNSNNDDDSNDNDDDSNSNDDDDSNDNDDDSNSNDDDHSNDNDDNSNSNDDDDSNDNDDDDNENDD